MKNEFHGYDAEIEKNYFRINARGKSLYYSLLIIGKVKVVSVV